MLRATLTLATLTFSTVATNSSGVVYTFGSRCPGCRQFGSGDFVEIFDSFGSAVPFALHPAVSDGGRSCIEESGCLYEKVTLCAFHTAEQKEKAKVGASSGNNSTAALADKVSFLRCMDEAGGSASTAASSCASQVGLDDGAIAACFGGSLGDSLLSAASEWFDASRIGGVPHVTVDGAFVQPEYAAVKSAICAAHSSAPACTGPVPPPGPGPAPSSNYKCKLFRGQCVADPDGKYSSQDECERKCG